MGIRSSGKNQLATAVANIGKILSIWPQLKLIPQAK